MGSKSQLRKNFSSTAAAAVEEVRQESKKVAFQQNQSQGKGPISMRPRMRVLSDSPCQDRGT